MAPVAPSDGTRYRRLQLARASERSSLTTASRPREGVANAFKRERQGESDALACNRRVAPVTAWRDAPRAAGGGAAGDEAGEV